MFDILLSFVLICFLASKLIVLLVVKLLPADGLRDPGHEALAHRRAELLEALAIDEASGLDKIEFVQQNPNEKLYQKAYKIISQYFPDDDEAGGAPGRSAAVGPKFAQSPAGGGGGGSAPAADTALASDAALKLGALSLNKTPASQFKF